MSVKEALSAYLYNNKTVTWLERKISKKERKELLSLIPRAKAAKLANPNWGFEEIWQNIQK